MDPLELVYHNHAIIIHSNGVDLEKITYDNESIPFYWSLFSDYLINARDNLFSSIESSPFTNEMLISGLSATSVDMKTNFIRGLSVILVLQRLIVKEKYLRISSLPSNYEIFTVNNLSVLKMCIIFHLKIVSDDRLLKHALDFINRWSCLFHKGDKVDKLEVMTEMIVRYLAPKETTVNPNYTPTLENRVRRLESILGINS